MQKSRVGTSSLETSRIAYGCWRLAGTWNPPEIGPDATDIARRAIVAAIESGITLFDHADIYCQGAAETLFGKILKDIPGMRRQILIATKCGIRAKDTPSTGAPYRYDFRKEYIVRSCESSLQRLGVDVIDLYQLHRPDYLMDPMEVAEAFTLLREQGKVREFGVSNFRPSQVEALQASLGFSLQVNQVEISLFQLGPLENGVLDQCLTRGMSPMAWSPLGEASSRMARHESCLHSKATHPSGCSPSWTQWPGKSPSAVR